MLEIQELSRIFLFKDGGQEIRLADPEPNFTEDEVLNFYAPTYPILTTARIEGPVIQNDEIQYKFVSTIGTKG